MHSVPRKLTLGLILAMGVAACGDDVTVEEQPDPTPVVRSVIVSPSSATIGAGGTFQFGASVDADAGLPNTVSWTASGGTGISVDQTGLAAASATATGTASICAAATANTAIRSCAQLAVTPAAPPATVQIDAITVGCTPLNGANPGFAGCGFLVPVAVNNVFAQIDVRGTVNRQNSSDVKAVRIEIFGTDAAGNAVGAAEYTNKETLLTDVVNDESLALQGVGFNSITHSVNTADYTLSPSNTAPTSARVFHSNGQKKIRLTLLGANDVPLNTSSTSERTLSFRNANGFHVVVNTNLNSGNNANSTCGATGTAACPVRVNALAGPTAGLAYNGGTPLDITALPVVYATGALHPNGFTGTLIQSAGTGVGFGSAACDLLPGGLGGGARLQSNTGVTVSIPAGTTGNIRGTLTYTNVTPTAIAPAPAGSVTGYQMAPGCFAALVGELPFGVGADASGNPLINFALGGFYTGFNTLNTPFGPVNATYPTAAAIRLDDGGPAPIFGYATGRNDIGVNFSIVGPSADACFGLFLNATGTTNSGFGCAVPPLTLLVGGVAGGASVNLNPQTAFVGSPALPAGRIARLNGWINSTVAFNALSQTAVLGSGLTAVPAAAQSSEGAVAPSSNATGLPLDAGIGAGVVGGNPVTLIGRVGVCTTVAACSTAPVRATGAGLAETSTGFSLGAIVQSVDVFGNLTNPPAPGSVGGPGPTANFGLSACPVTLPSAFCLNNPLNPAEPLVAGGVLRIGYDNTAPTVLSRGAGGTSTAGTTFTDNTIQGAAAANFDYQADDAVPAGLTGTSGVLSQAPGSDLYVSMSRRDGATTQFFCQPAGNYQPPTASCPSPLGTGLGWNLSGTTYVRGAGLILTDPAASVVRAYYQASIFSRDQSGNQTTAAVQTAQTRDFIFDNTNPASFGAAINPGVIPAGGTLQFSGSATEDLDIGRGAFSIRYPSLTASGLTADFIRLPWANKPAGTGILTNPIGYTDPGPAQVALALSLSLTQTWNAPIRSLEVVTAGENAAPPFLCAPVPPNGGFTCGAAAGNIGFQGGLAGGGVAMAFVQDGNLAGGAGPTQYNWFAQSVSRVGLIGTAATLAPIPATTPGSIPVGMGTALSYAQSGQGGQAHPCGGPVGAAALPAFWSSVQACGPLPGGVANQFFNMQWALVNPAAGNLDLSGSASTTTSKTLTAIAFGANGPMQAPFANGNVRFYTVDVRQPINIDVLVGTTAVVTGSALVEICGPNSNNTISILNDQATNTWQYTCVYNPSTGGAASVLQTNDLAGFNLANSTSQAVHYTPAITPGVVNAGFWGAAQISTAHFFVQGAQSTTTAAALAAATNMPVIAVGCNSAGNCLATRVSTNAGFNVQP